jgi:TonB family protein
MVQKSLSELHEYTADQYVKNTQKNIESYIYVLGKSTGYPIEMSNNFNKPLILKRMKMMTKKPSKWASTLKVMLAIPLLFGLILVFSIREMSAKAIPDLFKLETPTEVIVPTQSESGIIVNSNTPKVTTESKPIIVTSETPKDTIPKKILRFNEVDKPASFPGGMDKMMEYLKNNIQYPADCREKGIQGIVLVEFVITKKGKIEKVKVLVPVHPDLDAEAKRVISKMPKWEPAELNGKKVNTMYQIPINFKLQ